MESQIDINAEQDSSSYSGTFRWKSSKKLLSLPQVTSNLPREFPKVDLSKGWKNYFLSRGRILNFFSQHDETDHGDKLMKLALNDLSLVDCLSFPITIAYLLKEKNMLQIDFSLNYTELNLLCIGCSKKAEERIAFDTNVFDDLLIFFPNFRRINLWFIGPEMSSTKENCRESFNAQPSNRCATLAYHTYRGGVAQFFQDFPKFKTSTSTVMIGFNCGFGNFANPLPVRYNLLLNWIYDLYFITILQAIPFIGLCANDYEDLLHERFLMHEILGCYQITEAKENPFSMASTMVSDTPSANGGDDYSRGNSFYYAIQGYDMTHRKKLSSLKAFLNNPNDNSKQKLLLELLPYLQQMNNPNLPWRYREGKLALSSATKLSDAAITTPTGTAPPDVAVSKGNQSVVKKEKIVTIVNELENQSNSTGSHTNTSNNLQQQQQIDSSVISSPSSHPSQFPDVSIPLTTSGQINEIEKPELLIIEQSVNNSILTIEVSSSLVSVQGIDIQMHTSGLFLILQLPLVPIYTADKQNENHLEEIIGKSKEEEFDDTWAMSNTQLIWNQRSNMYCIYQKVLLKKVASSDYESKFSIQAKLKKKLNKLNLSVGCVD
jgi:hypothetical protein